MNQYREDCEVNKNDLENEILRQGQLYYDYLVLESGAIGDRDNAKQNIDIVRAEVDANIRENYEEYGFEKKPTEGAIKALIDKDEKVKEAIKDFIQEKKNSTIISGTLVALNHKKKSLELYMQGLLGGIFSEPKQGKQMKAERAKTGIQEKKKRKQKKEKK